ncbi:ACT domain-containing protein, partial [Streptomyces scabiei]
SPTPRVPEETVNREDNWKVFQIQGVLDFGLVGILAKISSVLAENNISIFAISTYNTDYILVKEYVCNKAVEILRTQKYEVLEL